MKKKIVIGLAVLILLVVSFFAGDPGDAPKESSVVDESRILQEKTEEEKVPSEDTWKDAEKKVQEEPEQEEKLPPKESSQPSEEPEVVQEVPPSDAEEENLCTLSVRCDSILENMDKLTEGKTGIVPQNGVLYPSQEVEFSEGESVFDVLYREMRKHKIHFEFVKTPMYDSVYIEGIGNLYEFDCGDYSGWIYRVNGVKSNVGCSQYQVKRGDVITFSYTCNFLKER